MNRVYNFAAGPAVIPESALQKAAEEMLCYEGTGMSVMEMSHRSKMYIAIYEKTVALVKELLNVPENYRVLLLQGGATGQFAAVAMNLLNKAADYIDSGNFANGAYKEACKYGAARIALSSKEDNYARIPELDPAAFDPDADYLHITTNNTIFGTRYTSLPSCGNVPLVADMSSNILSEPYDVSKFGVIYAGAQKNIGPAGVTLVIVREDLLGKAQPITPKILNWKLMAEVDSMVNTPSTYGIYIAGLCLDWLKGEGGVAAIEKRNIEKAQLLYDVLDASSLYHAAVQKEYRSRMNVTFRTDSEETDARFVKEAAAKGLVNLKGHRLTGGIRASIYNAMPVEGVKALAEFMKEFEKNA